jgi:hypothetical protein
LSSKKTTATHLSIPELVDCKGCSGKGFVKGMFHQMICDGCDGNGSLNAETGEIVSKEMMVLALRKTIAKQHRLIAWLKGKLPEKEQGHWEEFREVNGGRQRFD